MSNLLFISEDNDFSDDLIAQIKRFDDEMNIFTPADNPETLDLILINNNNDVAAKISKKYPKIPVILLSNTDNETQKSIFKVIKKPFRLDDLLLALSSCVNILENTQKGYLQFGSYELRPAKKEILCKQTGKIVKLTEKEVAIIKYLYKAKNRFVLKNELLENVWNYNAEVSTHTLETHIYRLRQKVEMGGNSPIPFIVTKEGGYRLEF